MKTILAAALLALSVAEGPAAAQSGGAEIFFVPASTRSISVSIGTMTTSGHYHNFNSIQVGSASVAGLPLVITNSGNIAASVAMRVSNQATDKGKFPGGADMNQHWTISGSTTTGNDTFALFAVFQSTQPSSSQFQDVDHLVSDSDTCATATKYGGSNQSGVRISPATGANTSNLWMILRPPTRSSNLKPKYFNVTVSAGGCD